MPKKLTQEYVEKYCLERGYRVMSTYINTNTKIKLKNIETDKIGYATFNNFQHGKRYDNPKATTKLTQEEVSRYCESQGYYLRSQYINANTKIKLQNIKTGVIGYTTFGNFQRGQRYDNPDTKVKLTFQKYIQPFIDNGYQVNITEEEYDNVNSQTKVNVICPNGHHQWSVTRNKFESQHRRCPICNQNTTGGMSYGERLVYAILSGNNIDFNQEYSIKINGEVHRFDFYFKINGHKYFIEYDGIQHYKESTGYLKGKLAEQQGKDRIKDKYAKDNGIIMVRIPYTENTVGKVVKMINDKMEVTLHKVKVGLPKKQEILDYYLDSNHSIKETSDRFGVSIVTVCNYAKDIWGMNKTDYLKTLDK